MRTYRLGLLLVVPLLALSAPSCADAKGFSINIRGEVRDCSDLEVVPRRGDEVARAEETLTLPQPGGGARLAVEGSKNGGVYVTGGAGRDYEVRVCKIATAATEAAAERALAGIRVDSGGGRLAVDGPENGHWLAYLLVTAPRGAAMAVSVHNGPLAVEEVDGDFQLRAQNGPISLKETAGTFDVAVQNGPVSIDEGGGEVKVRAQNGPISVDLSDGDWQGEGLDAQAKNGPLSLSVPESFRSGVVVEASGNSPWSCDGCSKASRTWTDEGRRFELGEAPVRVRLSTVNGPVSIEVR